MNNNYTSIDYYNGFGYNSLKAILYMLSEYIYIFV